MDFGLMAVTGTMAAGSTAVPGATVCTGRRKAAAIAGALDDGGQLRPRKLFQLRHIQRKLTPD
jgi:hypothetical protein